MKIDIGKWNYETKEYEPYAIPDGVTIVLYTPDMELPINCTGCFKPMVYGSGYTSRTLHTHIGLGYPVCEVCYQKEREAEKASKS